MRYHATVGGSPEACMYTPPTNIYDRPEQLSRTTARERQTLPITPYAFREYCHQPLKHGATASYTVTLSGLLGLHSRSWNKFVTSRLVRPPKRTAVLTGLTSPGCRFFLCCWSKPHEATTSLVLGACSTKIFKHHTTVKREA